MFLRGCNPSKYGCSLLLARPQSSIQNEHPNSARGAGLLQTNTGNKKSNTMNSPDTSTPNTAVFKKGDHISVNVGRPEKEVWKLATVRVVNSNGSCRIKWDVDGIRDLLPQSEMESPKVRKLYTTPVGALTHREKDVLHKLSSLFIAWKQLPNLTSPEDIEFCSSLLRAQSILALRSARRADPLTWPVLLPTVSPIKAGASKNEIDALKTILADLEGQEETPAQEGDSDTGPLFKNPLNT